MPGVHVFLYWLQMHLEKLKEEKKKKKKKKKHHRKHGSESDDDDDNEAKKKEKLKRVHNIKQPLFYFEIGFKVAFMFVLSRPPQAKFVCLAVFLCLSHSQIQQT